LLCCLIYFANRRANRMKVLVHDGTRIWLAARRMNQGQFVWPPPGTDTRRAIKQE
jgi:transposase